MAKYGKNAYVQSVFPEFDAEIQSRDGAISFANLHIDEILAGAENPARTVYTTHGYELGIACPSLVRHRVVGGHKRGRVIKKPPENGGSYNVIGYDKSNSPLFFSEINSFGTEDIKYFYNYDGYIWAAEIYFDKEINRYRAADRGNIYKFCYDEKGRIKYYASISSGSGIFEYYDYPQDPGGDIVCRYYYYVPNLSGSSRDIPDGDILYLLWQTR